MTPKHWRNIFWMENHWGVFTQQSLFPGFVRLNYHVSYDTGG